MQLYVAGGFDGYADSKEMTVRPGDVCVFDMNETLATQAVQSSAVTVVIPKLLVDRHWNARGSANGLVLPGTSALGHIVGAHLAALVRASPNVTVQEAPVVAEATARLAAAALAHCATGDGMANGTLGRALYLRAVHHIRGNLAEPGLSPESICRTLNVSRPHLYRAFKDRGGVMRAILEQRLRLAWKELSDPVNRDRTVGAIAFRCGFVSDSHFARLFRQTFGVRPSDVREAPTVAAGGEPSLPTWLSSQTFAAGWPV